MLDEIKAKILLDNRVVFLGTVLSQLDTSYSTSVPTGATNGKQILINEKFFKQLNQQEQIFLLLHEVMHVVLHHVSRIQKRDPIRYNKAGDYVINEYLIKQGFIMPDGGLYEAQYTGLSTEEIYELLPEEDDNEFNQDIIPNPDEETVDEIITQASHITCMRGYSDSIPSQVRKYLDSKLKPLVNWRIVLRKFLQELSKNRYSFNRPNRRFLPVYLPSLYSQDLSKITFAIDTSGSITDKQFNTFIHELKQVFKQVKPNKVQLILFDHKIQVNKTLKNASELHYIECKGYGGTKPSVAIEEFNTSDSVACIVITDGEFNTNTVIKPNKPVIWLVFNNPTFKIKYGKVIYVDLPR